MVEKSEQNQGSSVMFGRVFRNRTCRPNGAELGGLAAVSVAGGGRFVLAPGAPLTRRKTPAIPTLERPRRRPIWPNAAPSGRSPTTTSDYAANFSVPVAASTGTATGIAPRIMMEALFAAACRDLVDRWA